MNGEWVLVGESVDLLTYQAAIHGYETPARIWCAITQTSFLICITTKTYAGRYFICMYLYETSLLINTSENSCSCSCSYQRIESSSNVAMLKREPAIERNISGDGLPSIMCSYQGMHRNSSLAMPVREYSTTRTFIHLGRLMLIGS